MTIAEKFQKQCEDLPEAAANFDEMRANIIQEIWKEHGERHMVIDDADTLMAFTFPDGSGITLLSYFDLHFKVLTAREIKSIRKAPHMTDEQIETISTVCGQAPREDVEKILRGEIVEDSETQVQ